MVYGCDTIERLIDQQKSSGTVAGMNRKTIGLFLKIFIAFAAAGILVSLLMNGKHSLFVNAGEALSQKIYEKRESLEAMDGLELLGYYSNENPQDFEEQLRLELPVGTDSSDVSYELEDNDRELVISIPTDDEDYFYDYPIIGNSDCITNLFLSADGSNAVLDLELDGFYEYEVRASGHYAYVDLIPVSEIYDKILVVDLGHGGKDPGAYIGGSYEKDINLEIGLELKALLDADEDIKVYYTRTSDVEVSLNERVSLANSVEADLFLSIHNNMLSDSPEISGSQVMYSGSSLGDFSSWDFATVCLKKLITELGVNDKGLIEGDDIYIIRKAEMPVALVEVGFMTNSDELEKLNDTEYQKLAAQALYQAVKESFEQLKDTEE